MLRRFTPRSLYGRVFLIVVLPVLLAQGVATYVFFVRHWEQVTGNLSASAAGDMAAFLDFYDASQGELTLTEMAQIANEKMQLSVAFKPDRGLPIQRNRSVFSVLDHTLESALAERLDRPFWFDTTSYPDYVEVQVQFEDGILRMLALRERVFATNGHIFLLWMFVASLVLIAIALIFLRNQVRPIQRLAYAAEEFGRGRDDPEFRPAGATEVRRAARAFIGMRERIKRHIHQRTSMLAGVSHDLRTPLTRMKLALAMAEETEDVIALRADVDAMEKMLEEYLAFTRSQSAEEPDILDVADLLDEVCAESERARKPVRLEAQKELTVAMRRGAIKRAVHNLIANAHAHAETVELSARRDGDVVEIIVDDDGPGIAPEQYEEAFRPFSRIDEARNQNKGGVGLGLALVRDIARGHGGEVELSKSELGGLRAALRIPV